MFNFNFFKSAPAEAQAQENAWNPNTVAMQQPSSPAAPSTNQNVVSEQPVRLHPTHRPLSGLITVREFEWKLIYGLQSNQEDMSMQLRGGGGGGLCCGL